MAATAAGSSCSWQCRGGACSWNVRRNLDMYISGQTALSHELRKRDTMMWVLHGACWICVLA